VVDTQVLREVFDLTDPERNVLFGMSLEEARERVGSGEVDRVRGIDGQFALAVQHGESVRLARSLQVPMRYFIAKQSDGPGSAISSIRATRAWCPRTT
jgi:asparagine synthase (glutamine-hydrolysing)